MRVYRFADGTLLEESKFLVDNLQVSLQKVRAKWHGLTEKEKLQFAQAFSAKPDLLPEDEGIVDFLIREGNWPIRLTIAPLLPRHSDRSFAFNVLDTWIKDKRSPKANFFQAIELIGDSRAVPTLKSIFTEFEQRREKLNENELFDYVYCCKALWGLTHEPEYERAIRKCRQSNVLSVRVAAEALLN